MLTGTSEPQQNKQFLNTFALIHRLIGKPFTNIEMQTTGVLLDKNPDYLRFLKNFVCVNTIAISLNSLSADMNSYLLGNNVDIKQLCDNLKNYGFNIRICCNLTKKFDLDQNPFENVFKYFKEVLRANQVTLRQMYCSDIKTEQGKWLAENAYPDEDKQRLEHFLKQFIPIGKTLYGTTVRDVNGMSVVYDGDCMGKKPEAGVLKYLILRPNCHLYSQWDSTASLVF